MQEDKRKDNLVSLGSRPIEDRKKIASKGGLASVQAKKEKKLMKDICETLLSLPMKKGKVTELESLKSIEDIESKNLTIKDMIIYKQLLKALEGDIRSAEFIQRTIGEDEYDIVKNLEEKQRQEASGFVLAIKKRLDLLQIEGVDYEINEKGEKIPLKNGFPLQEEINEDFTPEEQSFIDRERNI